MTQTEVLPLLRMCIESAIRIRAEKNSQSNLCIEHTIYIIVCTNCNLDVHTIHCILIALYLKVQ